MDDQTQKIRDMLERITADVDHMKAEHEKLKQMIDAARAEYAASAGRGDLFTSLMRLEGAILELGKEIRALRERGGTTS